MTDSVSTVQVSGADGTIYDVAGNIINGVFYPIYKQSFGSDGELTHVDDDNPLPVLSGNEDIKRHDKLMSLMSIQVEILRKIEFHLSIMSNENIGAGDI